MIRVIPNINLLIKSYQKINYADSALRNLLNFLVEIPQENYNSQKIQNEIDFKKNISLRNISFGYNSDNEIFDKANLIIKKNSIIGIKGKSGVGKSTLIDILVGLISPKSGEILIDDKNIANLEPTIQAFKIAKEIAKRQFSS